MPLIQSLKAELKRGRFAERGRSSGFKRRYLGNIYPARKRETSLLQGEEESLSSLSG